MAKNTKTTVTATYSTTQNLCVVRDGGTIRSVTIWTTGNMARETVRIMNESE